MAAPAPELITDDDGLLDRARQKDRAAIQLIIQRHNRRLYRIARGILRNDDEAERSIGRWTIAGRFHLERDPPTQDRGQPTR